MTINDARDVMRVLKAGFPVFYSKRTSEEIKDSILLLASMFEEDNVEDVMVAVRSFIRTDTKGFPPAIGQIIELMSNKLDKDIPSESVAWEKVRKAACNGNYCSVEEFNKLDPIIRKTLGSPEPLKEWALMTPAELNTVVASNFQRAYRAEVQKQKQINCLSEKEKLALGIVETEAPVARIPEPKTFPEPSEEMECSIPEDWLEKFLEEASRDDEEMQVEEERTAYTKKCEKTDAEFEASKKKALEQIEFLKRQENGHG